MQQIFTKYKNLISAVELFDNSWLESLGIEGNRISLKRLISEGKISSKNLINEYNRALKTKDFDWIKVASELNLMNADELQLYSERELQNYIGFLLFPIIHERFLDSDFKDIEEVISIEFGSNKQNNTWISKKYLDRCILERIQSYKPYFLLELIERKSEIYEVFRDNVNKLYCFDKIRFKN